MEQSVPASTISSLSSGEFVGIVADNPDQIIELKAYHASIMNDHGALKKEKMKFLPLPEIRKVDQKEIYSNYLLIKQDTQDIIDVVMEQVVNDPGREGLVMKKG